MSKYPSFNDREFDLLKKIAENTAEISDAAGGPGGFLTEPEADLLYLKQLSNLSDLNNVTTARNNLGLGAADTPVFTGINFGNVNVLSNFAAGQIALNHVGGTTPAIVLQENGVDAGYWSSASTNGRLNAQGTLSLTSGDTGARILLATAAGGGSVTLTPVGTGSVLSAQFGTATNAAYSFVGDTDVGIYRSAANVLGFTAGGSVATATTTAWAFPSTLTAGLQLYNTADQTTNYERLEMLFSGNVARIRTTSGGSGSGRSLFLSGGVAPTGDVTLSGSLPRHDFTYTSGLNQAGNWTRFGAATFAQSSGINAVVAITPTYNQTSTAGATDLLINRTETAIGSGPQYWEDRQVGGISRLATGSARVATTNATVTTLQTYTIPASTTWSFDGYVVARRTGGTAGTAEDGASYRVEAVFNNIAGTATAIGSTVTVIGESQAGWDVTIDATGATARIRVTGAADNNVTWVWTGNVRQVSS